jgi:hypothetical protein
MRTLSPEQQQKLRNLINSPYIDTTFDLTREIKSIDYDILKYIINNNNELPHRIEVPREIQHNHGRLNRLGRETIGILNTREYLKNLFGIQNNNSHDYDGGSTRRLRRRKTRRLKRRARQTRRRIR